MMIYLYTFFSICNVDSFMGFITILCVIRFMAISNPLKLICFFVFSLLWSGFFDFQTFFQFNLPPVRWTLGQYLMLIKYWTYLPFFEIVKFAICIFLWVNFSLHPSFLYVFTFRLTYHNIHLQISLF